ncbi:MAG: hypothetical protein GTO08_10200 [Deltaproteobacteria bacterium]|nr:hypothetical protein [Deltaproteobacteria bacterium]
MYRLIEIIVNTAFWVTLFLLTLLSIKLADIFESNWLLLLIPIFLGLNLYLFLYIDNYVHYIFLAIYRYRYRKESARDEES